jgi:Xaa-Pro aminopeptidase
VVKYAADVEVKPGMVITDEPGYYEEGKFGIRIENALLCKSAQTAYGGQSFMEFEVIALVPICLKLIDATLLTSEEKTWLNDYHSRCRQVIGAELQKRGFSDVHNWLYRETVPL